MHFHIVVGAEPFVQLALIVGCPQDGAVQETAVLKAVGKSADVDAASLAKVIDSQLYFFVILLQDRSSLVSVNIFLSFTEIDVAFAVLCDEMLVLIPVIFVHIQSKAILF